jgi:hypothetical protein
MTISLKLEANGVPLQRPAFEKRCLDLLVRDIVTIIHHECFDAILLAPHPSNDARGHIQSLLSRQVHPEGADVPDP